MKRLIILSTAALAACASAPEDIKTTYISPVQYQNYDCNQISMEITRVNRRAADLQASLTKKADNDSAQMGVGLILFWPTLFFLEGGDGPEAQEYARLKGEREALESAAVQKRCGVNSVQQQPAPNWSQPQQSTNGYQVPPAYNPTPYPNYGNSGYARPQGTGGRSLEEILGK